MPVPTSPPDSVVSPPARPAVSERRREASRRNLEKARAAPRAFIYRVTEPRLAACRKNIAKAVEWHRTSRTPNYAPGFRHGHAARNDRLTENVTENRRVGTKGWLPRIRYRGNHS